MKKAENELTDRVSILTGYLSRPRSTRARLLYGIGVFVSLLIFPIVSRLYEEMSGLRSLDPVGFDYVDPPLALLTRLIAFLVAPCMLIPPLLQALLMRQGDLTYEERPWKTQARRLLRMEFRFWYTVAALAVGIVVAVLFDMHIASSVHLSPVGWTARVVADSFVFALFTIIFAVIAFRRG